MSGGIETLPPPTGAPSLVARSRMLSRRGEPLLIADWADVLMVHLEVEPSALQCATPFTLDLFDGRAFVSLVFFTMRRMRPRRGGRLGEWLFRPIATHEFLNVRTYVEHDGETGFQFLAEWLPNALSVQLGPGVFGLPYRLGEFHYQHDADSGEIGGQVIDVGTGTRLAYHGNLDCGDSFAPCAADSFDEWLMERYTAFTNRGDRSRFFRVWHPPWPQVRAEVELDDNSLLRARWPWLAEGQAIGANYSPGFRDVWMGRPQRTR